MRQWKRILAVGLGLTLTFSQAAYADFIIPPIPTVGIPETQTGNGLSTTPSLTAPENGWINGTVPVPGAVGNYGTSALPGGPDTAVTETAPSVPDAVGTGNTAGSGNAAGSGNTAGSGSTAAALLEEPKVEAEGAVLMDAATGQVLFGKNQDTQFYPASITKVMTALLVLEHCSLDETVTFSAAATTNLESGAVALGIVEGDQLTVEQCLYGLLLKSANEIGNGLAEHVAGSVSAFADMMNAKAKELGCKNTHFANPHGLNDPDHKTTPYDMALILRAALQNETFRKIDTTLTYEFPATKKNAARTTTMGHKMMYPSDSRYYEGIIGGKTGYTSLAGNTLVTGVERNGVRLIAVVMKSKSSHYTDTKAMLDYGFANYQALTGRSGSQDGTASQPGSAGPAGSAGQTGTAGQPGTGTQPGTGGQPGNTSQTGTVQAGTWGSNESGWYYIKADGTYAANEWQTIGGYDYWFDGNCYMATGWRNFTDGSWYYFDPASGTMVANNWIQDGGSWYYLGSDGRLLTNTVTPDGLQVDEYGIWTGQ